MIDHWMLRHTRYMFVNGLFYVYILVFTNKSSIQHKCMHKTIHIVWCRLPLSRFGSIVGVACPAQRHSSKFGQNIFLFQKHILSNLYFAEKWAGPFINRAWLQFFKWTTNEWREKDKCEHKMYKWMERKRQKMYTWNVYKDVQMHREKDNKCKHKRM